MEKMKKGAKLIAPFILMTDDYFFVLKYGRSVSLQKEYNIDDLVERESIYYKKFTGLYENGRKKREVTYKNGKNVNLKCWDEEGNLK